MKSRFFGTQRGPQTRKKWKSEPSRANCTHHYLSLFTHNATFQWPLLHQEAYENGSGLRGVARKSKYMWNTITKYKGLQFPWTAPPEAARWSIWSTVERRWMHAQSLTLLSTMVHSYGPCSDPSHRPGVCHMQTLTL